MILVTGAGGKIGSTLTELLKDCAFRAGYHSLEKTEAARRRGLDAVRIDFAVPETLAPALDGVETVFLLSTGVPGQIELECKLIEAAGSAGVKRIVKLSVWDAPQERHEIAAKHRAVEQAVEASGLMWTFLRPNGFMQNFIETAESIKTQGVIYMPAMDARISLIDTRDVARVAAEVLTTSGHESKAYELSGPEGLTYSDVAAAFSRVLGAEIAYVAVSDEAAKEAMLSAGLSDRYVHALIDLYRAYRTGVASQVTPTVEALTGRRPTHFEQFVADHAATFR